MNPALKGVAEAHAAGLNQRYGNPVKAPDGRIGPWTVLVWWVIVPASVLSGLVLHMLPAVVVPFSLIFTLLLAIPWPLAKLLLIRFGLAKPAYYVTLAADYVFRIDRKGGAAVAAAWALNMQREPDEATIEWLAHKLDGEPLGGAGVLASGLLLAARGDLAGARTLVGAVLDVDARVCPPEAKRLASEWLAVDAAERGEWMRVAELGQTLSQGGRLTWLLSAIAQSLLLEPMSPGKVGLWLRWALAPRRAATLPLVERAQRALDGAFIDPEGDEDPPIAPASPEAAADAIRTALSLHASVLTRKPLRAEDVRAAGQAWDAALFDKSTERLVLERALVLGATGATSVIAKMRGQVEDDLTALVLGSGLDLKDLGDKGEVASRVRLRLRDKLLTEIEAASDAIKRRVDDKRALPPADEWREWSTLRATYERGVRSAGDDLRRLAYVKVYPDACAYAVWLFNDQKQRPLGNAIFRWLLVEAELLDDTRAIALMTKNVACGV